jgi:hypothetical protein
MSYKHITYVECKNIMRNNFMTIILCLFTSGVVCHYPMSEHVDDYLSRRHGSYGGYIYNTYTTYGSYVPTYYYQYTAMDHQMPSFSQSMSPPSRKTNKSKVRKDLAIGLSLGLGIPVIVCLVVLYIKYQKWKLYAYNRFD